MRLFTQNNTEALRWCGKQIIYVLAYIWRTLLFRTTFTAITGSLGKTTTKECVAAILSTHLPTAKTLRNQNDGREGKNAGIPRIGFNYRMTNLQAALGVAQLERIDRVISLKRRNAEFIIPYRGNRWDHATARGTMGKECFLALYGSRKGQL
jgi:hypothetical protein